MGLISRVSSRTYRHAHTSNSHDCFIASRAQARKIKTSLSKSSLTITQNGNHFQAALPTLLLLYTIFQYHERGDTEASHQLCTGLLTKRTDELRNLQEALDKKQRLLSEAQRKLQKGESEALTLQRMVDQKSGKISNLQKMLYEKRDGEGGAMGDLEAVQESQQVVADGKLTKNYAHKLAIIVPFRDRFDELLVFAPWMHKFLPKQLTSENTAFEIFVINQADKYRFNRASLINVGYWAA